LGLELRVWGSSCLRRIATLREAFQNTPAWLGFNIELKYPTDAELASMPTRFYSRNYFCDAVLRVRPTDGPKPASVRLLLRPWGIEVVLKESHKRKVASCQDDSRSACSSSIGIGFSLEGPETHVA
jgi:hypothetical protein